MSHHITSNGQYLGEVTKKLHYRNNSDTVASSSSYSSTVREQHFSSVTGESMAQHVVRRGDSLRTLAQLYYGNADYWYLIANANGLAAEAETGLLLTEGMTLDIPARASTFNSHTNFKPMDLVKIIGDTTPAVPYIPPPPKAACNAVAMIVIIAVVVMVTVATQGAMTKDAVTWGAKAMAAATAAAAGDAAGQITAIALNQQNGFDAGRTLRSAGTAFVTAGVSHGFGQTAPSSGEGFWASRAGDTVQLSNAGRAAVAASGVLGGMAINRLTTGHSGFSWRQVASSALMAGMGGRLPLEGTGNIVQDTLSGIAQSGLQYGIAKALGDNKVSWNFRNVATDSFGNALGNSIVRGLSNQQTEQQAERKGNEAFEKAKAAGMTDTQASKVATDEMLSMLPPEKRRQLLVDNDGERLSINFAGKNGKVDRNQGGLSMSMGGDDFRSRHASLVDFISDEGLWGNSQMLGLATGLLDKRAAYYSYDSITKRGQQAFESAAANSQARYNHINRDRIAQQQQFNANTKTLSNLNNVQLEINKRTSTVPAFFKALGVTADVGLNMFSSSYEGREISRLMHNFVTGEGPKEYFYGPESPLTKSIMSADSVERNWQLYLSTRSGDIANGREVKAYKGEGAWAFNTVNGRDAIIDATFSKDTHMALSIPGSIAANIDIYPTRHFIGRYNVLISDLGNGSASIKVMNDTSLESYTRNIFDGSGGIPSYDRVVNQFGLLTPYGTITQTYEITRPYPSWVYGKK